MISATKVAAPLTKDDFYLLKVIGKGSFGKVLLVRGKRDKRVYALKILMKSRVLAKKQVEHTRSERKILEEISHPFLCRLEFAFQTEGKLYLGMEFLAGGPLFYHLQQCHRFSEDRARFYIAEVIVGIGHLHEHNILYRDMKPENILLDKEGHIVITDFGLSKLTEAYNATDAYGRTVADPTCRSELAAAHDVRVSKLRGAGGAAGTPLRPRGRLVERGDASLRDDRRTGRDARRL